MALIDLSFHPHDYIMDIEAEHCVCDAQKLATPPVTAEELMEEIARFSLDEITNVGNDRIIPGASFPDVTFKVLRSWPGQTFHSSYYDLSSLSSGARKFQEALREGYEIVLRPEIACLPRRSGGKLIQVGIIQEISSEKVSGVESLLFEINAHARFVYRGAYSLSSVGTAQVPNLIERVNAGNCVRCIPLGTCFLVYQEAIDMTHVEMTYAAHIADRGGRKKIA